VRRTILRQVGQRREVVDLFFGITVAADLHG
jgi:hypothetical protein